MLSATDVTLIQQWQSAGIPVEVVCRALHKGAERYRDTNGPDARLPKSLSYFRPVVEEELIHRQESTVFEDVPVSPKKDHGDDLLELLWIGKNETCPQRKSAYRAAWRVLRSARESDRLAALRMADREAIDTFFNTLSDEEKNIIHTAVETRLPAAQKQLGTRGYTLRKQAAFDDEICERYKLVRLAQCLLE